MGSVSKPGVVRTAAAVACLAGLAASGCSQEDPLDLEEWLDSQPGPAVYPVVETDPVRGGGDAADDPAIWVHPEDPSRSLILGTDKRRGLSVYDLTGREVQFLPRGRINNVDLRQGVAMADGPVTLAVATNRSERSMDIFTLSPQGRVELAMAQALEIDDPYGICMHLDGAGAAHAYVNGSDGSYEFWRLTEAGELLPRRIDRFSLPTKPEGCVVDDATSVAYIGEEEHGIWKMPARVGGSEDKTLFDSVQSDRLTADVEGLDIYRGNRGEAILVASSQGDDSYAFYDLNTGGNYLGSVRVVHKPEVIGGVLDFGGGIDGAEETDGLAVSAVNFGPGLEQGILVVQDGFNSSPDERQNFKVAPWSAVAQALDLSPADGAK